MSDKSKVAIYLRVCPSEQTAENQLPALETYAAKRRHDVSATYHENESAWRNGRQSELKRLDEDARKRKSEVVSVWALDRLSRWCAVSVMS